MQRGGLSCWATLLIALAGCFAACGENGSDPCTKCCESTYQSDMRRRECATLGAEGSGPCRTACRGDGGISVEGTPDRCPTIDGLDVGPLASDLGGRIRLSVVASDADGDPLTFAWKAVDQTFSSPSASLTFYRCVYPGDQTLTIVVSDGRCSVTQSIDVTCQQ